MKFIYFTTAINTLPQLDLQTTFASALRKVLNTSNYQELQRINELTSKDNADTTNSNVLMLANSHCDESDRILLKKMQTDINEILRNKDFQNSHCLATIINGQSVALLLHTLLIDIIEFCPNNKARKRISIIDKVKSSFYLCPLSNEPIKTSTESITLTSGYIYNLENLTQWLGATKNLICPVSKMPLTPLEITAISERIRNDNVSEKTRSILVELGLDQQNSQKNPSDGNEQSTNRQTAKSDGHQDRKRSKHAKISFLFKRNTTQPQKHSDDEPNLLEEPKKKGTCNII